VPAPPANVASNSPAGPCQNDSVVPAAVEPAPLPHKFEEVVQLLTQARDTLLRTTTDEMRIPRCFRYVGELPKASVLSKNDGGGKFFNLSSLQS
jgi:hypothetical protein